MIGRTSVLPHPSSYDHHRNGKEGYSAVCVLSSQNADGTSYLEHGLTQVLVFVHGPREPVQRRGGAGESQPGAGAAGGAGSASHVTGLSRGGGSASDFNVAEELAPAKASIHVEFCMAPFSALERKKRGRNDRRLQEMSASIRATFEPVIMTHLYPRSEILIQIYLLQQDGAVLQTALNATTLALTDAGVAMNDLVACCTVAAIIGKQDPQRARATSELPITPVVDVSSPEESDLPVMTIATLYRSGQVCLLTSESRMHEETFKRMFHTGLGACRVVGEELNGVIGTGTLALARRIKGEGRSGNIESTDENDLPDEFGMIDNS